MHKIPLPLALPLALAIVVHSSRAHAAVAECLAEMAGKTAAAGSEIEAKRLALADWLAKAKTIGIGYTRWEIAYNRRITCQRDAGGQHVCQAIGRPCTIKQVPNPELKTLKRAAPP